MAARQDIDIELRSGNGSIELLFNPINLKHCADDDCFACRTPVSFVLRADSSLGKNMQWLPM